MTYASEVLADSPLAYWRMGDSSGTTMTDSSGNGRNATYVGTPTLGATGLLSGDSDTAVSFNGTSQYGQIADAAWMDVTNISITAAIKATSLSSVRSIVMRDGYPGDRIFQFSVNAGKLQFIFWTSGGGPYFCNGSTTLSTGTAYHVGATYDGTTAYVYLNGAQDGSLSQSGSLKTGAWKINVGTYYDGFGAAQLFAGTIDEPAIFGTGLSSTRVLAQATVAGLVSTPTPRRDPGAVARRNAAVTRASRL